MAKSSLEGPQTLKEDPGPAHPLALQRRPVRGHLPPLLCALGQLEQPQGSVRVQQRARDRLLAAASTWLALELLGSFKNYWSCPTASPDAPLPPHLTSLAVAWAVIVFGAALVVPWISRS